MLRQHQREIEEESVRAGREEKTESTEVEETSNERGEDERGAAGTEENTESTEIEEREKVKTASKGKGNEERVRR